METLREKYGITPKIQRELAKDLCEKLTEIMISLEGEDKINLKLDQFLSLTGIEELNFKLEYHLYLNSNEFKIWINEFLRKGKRKC